MIKADLATETQAGRGWVRPVMEGTLEKERGLGRPVLPFAGVWRWGLSGDGESAWGRVFSWALESWRLGWGGF